MEAHDRGVAAGAADRVAHHRGRTAPRSSGARRAPGRDSKVLSVSRMAFGAGTHSGRIVFGGVLGNHGRS